MMKAIQSMRHRTVHKRSARTFLLCIGFGALLAAGVGVATAEPSDLHDVFNDDLTIRSTVQTPANLDEFLRAVTE